MPYAQDIRNSAAGTFADIDQVEELEHCAVARIGKVAAFRFVDTYAKAAEVGQGDSTTSKEPPLMNLRIAPYVIPDRRDMFQAAEVRFLPLIFAENEEKTWGELDIFPAFAITENPYNSRVSGARSSNSTGDSGS